MQLKNKRDRNKSSIIRMLVAVLFLFFALSGFSQMIDLTNAKIISAETNDPLVMKAISFLKKEIDQRTGVELRVINKWVLSEESLIILGMEGHLDGFPEDFRAKISAMPSTSEEGYKIAVHTENKTVVFDRN